MKAHEIVSKVLLKMAEHVRPDVTTFTLDSIAAVELKRLGGFSYNKGYKPDWVRFAYPATTCISVNNEMAHGVPSERKLKEGDIVNLDLGVIDSEGNCGDAAFSLPVGQISEENKRLLHYAKSTLYAGIARVKNGVRIGEIAQAMERKAGERKFVINRQLTGHKIGKEMHEQPFIYHVTNHNAHREKAIFDEYEKHMDIELKTGWIICLEPILTFNDPWGVIDPKTGWTFYTGDGRNAAMFEHMIRVLDDGYEILTTHFEPFKL